MLEQRGGALNTETRALTEPDIRALAEELMQTGIADLSPRERSVLERLVARVHHRQPGDAANRLSFGEKLADRVARFGGSWHFILVLMGMLASWARLNTSLGPALQSALRPLFS